MLKTVAYKDEELIILDQTLLPTSIVYKTLNTTEDVFDAIATLKVRGAPLIGVVAAYGVLIGIKHQREDPELLRKVKEVCSYVKGARPTAVNLSWALDRMLSAAENYQTARNAQENKYTQAGENTQDARNDKTGDTDNADNADNADNTNKTDGQRESLSLYETLTLEAQEIHKEDTRINKRIGKQCYALIKDKINNNSLTIMTHCNAGALGTTGYGTATSVMYLLKEQGVDIKVFVCETRPLLQGARLTTLELLEADIDVTLITDNMAATVLSKGNVDCVIVGADRVAANLDVANKVGTLGLSIIAKHFGVPFYVACPSPTFDKDTACGEDIVIEEREGSEITTIGGKAIAPQNTKTYNPAFDVTPYEQITAVITEHGILERPEEG